MDSTTTTPQVLTENNTPKGLFRDIVVCLLMYPLILSISIKIVMTVLDGAMHTYADIGAAIPWITMFAIQCSGFLAYYGIIIAITAGPLLACIHVALRSDPPRKRRFVRTIATVLCLGTTALLLAVALPLFSI